MGRLIESTSAWKPFHGVLCMPVPGNGILGCIWPNFGITHAVTQLWDALHLKFFMAMLHAYLVCLLLMLSYV